VFDASMRDHRRQQLIARRRRLIERMASAAS